MCSVVECWLHTPMLMIGSGGSFSTATFAASIHEKSTTYIARAATPLEIISQTKLQAGVACFSASGRNHDIVAAYRTAALREINPLTAFVLSDNSPLHKISKRFQYANLISISHPTFRDGFLAVASLVASTLILLRAYRNVLGFPESQVPDSVISLIREVTSFEYPIHILEASDEVTCRDFISVLYSHPLTTAAIDLESRFVEAALGALHIADLRNFGHGRHVWLAKRASATGVIALISNEQSSLGEKTIQLLPSETAVMQIDFNGTYDLQAIAGLIVGLYIAESAGRKAKIDPSKPGVPSFGRALYRLNPDAKRIDQKTLNRDAAIRRKFGNPDSKWIEYYHQACQRLSAARFAGLVTDYDGTLCDPRERYSRLSQPIANELARLCKEGACIAIATGRGSSAGEELKKALPDTMHNKILVGYYNCGIIRSLAEEAHSLVSKLSTKDPLVVALSREDLFAEAVFRANELQISIEVGIRTRITEAVILVQKILSSLQIRASVVASSHSIDVLLKSQSKLDIMKPLIRSRGSGGPFLRIGDKGRWPGNDADLLNDPFGLSVDESSSHPSYGWALAPAGVKGVQATLYYLRRLSWSKTGGRLKLTLGARE